MAQAPHPARVGGVRPRPRVAFLGRFDEELEKRLKAMFPTVWLARTETALDAQVSADEIDLLIIWPGATCSEAWQRKNHVISFSEAMEQLCGPIDDTQVVLSGRATTEEYLLPEVALGIDRIRRAALASVSSVRGWCQLRIKEEHWEGPIDRGPLRARPDYGEARDLLKAGSILFNRASHDSLAFRFLRRKPVLGVAWLPHPCFDPFAWIPAIVDEWAATDPDSFPGFSDWSRRPEWMLSEEVRLTSEIDRLEDEKTATIRRIDSEVAVATEGLMNARRASDVGLRRLLTAKGDELVVAVASAFTGLGFDVEKLDEQLTETEPRREDIRLAYKSVDGQEWRAIVEVRGHAKSGGQAADLLRLDRFARLFQEETGRPPNKRIYVLNGQIDLGPSSRDEPLAAAPDILQAFGENDGLLVWTVDLFRVMKGLNETDLTSVRSSIIDCKGRWVPNV